MHAVNPQHTPTYTSTHSPYIPTPSNIGLSFIITIHILILLQLHITASMHTPTRASTPYTTPLHTIHTPHIAIQCICMHLTCMSTYATSIFPSMTKSLNQLMWHQSMVTWHSSIWKVNNSKLCTTHNNPMSRTDFIGFAQCPLQTKCGIADLEVYGDMAFQDLESLQ